jgi:hypothetical protein
MPGFFGGEFMSRSFLVGGFSSFASDFPLFRFIHGAKSAFAWLCHRRSSLSDRKRMTN